MEIRPGTHIKNFVGGGLPQDFEIDGGGDKISKNFKSSSAERGQKNFSDTYSAAQRPDILLVLLFIAVLRNNFSKKHEKFI